MYLLHDKVFLTEPAEVFITFSTQIQRSAFARHKLPKYGSNSAAACAGMMNLDS
jgi:hypothetical protein